jgi:hypothetical protein
MVTLGDFITNHVSPQGNYHDCGDARTFWGFATYAKTNTDSTICFRFLTPRVGKEYSTVVVTVDSGKRQKNGQMIYFCIFNPESVEQAEKDLLSLLELAEKENEDESNCKAG